ncbi:two-component system regulatory protein YycI [Terrilactibacillus laevilacticus]|uniref:Two-component system regulatory protein YycI n=1 Tax=Terrilactibacillus laevilacticus TaxID=1380157 RepID=A0ABW5PNV9_9BACI|nr:two-component system regulatory protein YycI [Terrilactibacillus laevilacticus]
MNWSKTKTIFIICFLLLNIFLAYEFYQRQSEELTMDSPTQDITQTKNNVKIDTEIPKTPENVTFIIGEQQSFVKNDKNDLIDSLKSLQDTKDYSAQTIKVTNNGRTIEGTFEHPVDIPKQNKNYQQIIQKLIYKGNEYTYSSTDKDGNLHFIQVFDSTPVYIKDHNGFTFLNLKVKNHQIISYTQRYFVFTKTNKVDIINATGAYDNLIQNNILSGYKKNITLKKINLAYFNSIGNVDQNDTMVFFPTWHMQVKTEKDTHHYFVNAVSSEVQTLGNGE